MSKIRCVPEKSGYVLIAEDTRKKSAPFSSYNKKRWLLIFALIPTSNFIEIVCKVEYAFVCSTRICHHCRKQASEFRKYLSLGLGLGLRLGLANGGLYNI